MKQNPLEQQQTKIETLRREMKEKFEHFFDIKDTFLSKVDSFVLQLEAFEVGGLVLDKEQIIKDLKESITIEDKEKFVARLMEILEPIMMFKITHPKIVEKIERDVELKDNLRLSEVLSAEFNEEEGKVNIHLAPATELIKDEGIGNFKKEVEVGLKKLAEILLSNDKIKEVWATSWIVAKNPTLVKRLGFIPVGKVPYIENDAEYFDNQGQKRPFASAVMKREDFLARYGDQTAKQEPIKVAWERILSRFPKKLQEEFKIERPNPDQDDIEMFESVHLLIPDPVSIPIEELLIKNKDVVLRAPLDVFEEINQKYKMGLEVGNRHFHEQNPSRLREYSEMSAETADPSVLLDGEIWFGTGRFIAALLRGDKKLQVWNLGRK